MEKAAFLKALNAAVRDSLASDEFLDAYRIADHVRSLVPEFVLSRRAAADWVMAAAVMHGAPIWLDPAR